MPSFYAWDGQVLLDSRGVVPRTIAIMEFQETVVTVFEEVSIDFKTHTSFVTISKKSCWKNISFFKTS